jgi:DMSO/TMAO reductase YedYZ heme-binding membrane subunit
LHHPTDEARCDYKAVLWRLSLLTLFLWVRPHYKQSVNYLKNTPRKWLSTYCFFLLTGHFQYSPTLLRTNGIFFQ